MSTALPSSRSDDSSTAAEWRARFLAAHPSGECEAFEVWAAEQPGLAEDEALRGRVRDALEKWQRSQGLLEFGPDEETDSTFFVRGGGERRGQPAEGLSTAVQPGQRIGRFVCKSFLARGGMGQVWIAEDTDLRRDVALKLVLPERVDTKALELFAREARAGGRLSHPNLVTTLAHGTDGGLSWIAQELVEGSWTLKDFLDDLRAADKVPEGYYAKVAKLIAQLADALQAAHDTGVIHRDVKPANVLIAPNDQPKLTDFGLARISDESLLSITGEFAGTWSYMSPEQVTAKRMGLDHRTDVFSLGVVLYELLALRRPFEGDTTHQIAQKIITHEPPEASKVRSQCPKELAVICGKALEKDPDRRYLKAAEFAADLRRHLANEPILASPPGPVIRAVKWTQRNPTLSSAAAVGLVALLVVSGFAVSNARLAEANAEQTRIAEAHAEQAALNEAEADRNAEAARMAEALAEAQRDRAEEERERAEMERADVLRLSAQQDLADLLDQETTLWPPYPENLEAYRTWTAVAEALIADLPLHVAKREELRAMALPRADEQREAERRAHPEFEALQALEAELGSKRRALTVRRSTATIELPSVDRARLPEDRSEWNGIAWDLVRPDQTAFGEEARGLAIAVEALTTATGDQRAAILDTLAWGRFALGDDEGALEAGRAALEAARKDETEAYQGYLDKLTAAVEAARSGEGLAAASDEIAALETRVVELDAAVSERIEWAFPEREENARWWNTQLTQLIEGLETLRDDLMAADVVTAEHGWSVGKRLAFAESLAAGFAAGGEYDLAWAAVLPTIRASHPSLAELTPQMGLVPIGTDPDSGLWEFAHLATGTPAERGEDRKLILTEETGVVLVLIPGGTFVMGAQSSDPDGPNYDPQAWRDEGPPHEVTLSPYLLSKFEMTQGQWLAATGTEPSYYKHYYE
ncbi:MAG: bifunctional serine/threonine-protein kinase/formylglycine-generating enzyme family protein, partial [Planctomycetota bacterium]